MEMSLQKSEQELEKAERKYHEATRDVEIARQSCDTEMCRVSDLIRTSRSIVLFSLKIFSAVILCKIWKLIDYVKLENLFKRITMQSVVSAKR